MKATGLYFLFGIALSAVFQRYVPQDMMTSLFGGNEEVVLTAKEYGLLCLLAANKNQVLTYEQIYRKVWKEEVFGNVSNAIKCHIRNLREKLNGAEQDASFAIRCVREVGYCLQVDSEEIVIT